jgi:hypothetical protein
MADNEEPQDLRSVLSQVVADSESEAPPVERPERAERAPATEVQPSEAAAGSDERPRGPDGKFLPKDAAQQTNGEDHSGEFDLEPSAGKGDEPAPAVADPPVDVPQHWSQADKDLIAGLPKEHQGKVVERYKAIEAGFTPRLQKAAEIERQYQGAMEIFAPHVEGLRQQGRTPSDIIRAWASIEQDMLAGRQQGGGNDPGARHVARMIASYGIDPGRVAAYLRGEQPEGNMGGAAAPPPVQIPPQLLQEITTLRTQVNDITTNAQTARETETQAQIDAFANEKDEAGVLKHPYLSELERDMMAFAQIEISQGKRPQIADLYEKAVYANRETRSKLLAANTAETQRKAAAERRAKAEAATRAASSVTGTPGSGGSPAERRGTTRSLRQELEDAAAEADTA